MRGLAHWLENARVTHPEVVELASKGDCASPGMSVGCRRSEAAPRPLLAIAALPALVALGACSSGDPEAIGLESSVNVQIDVVLDYGAIADGTTDNEPMIQAALDFAAASGGGAVYIPPGVYGIARPLIVRSGVNLSGEGRGSTIIRSLVPTWGKIADQAGVTAAIAMVAADNASVTNLTVDLSVARTDSNGIVALPSGADFEGTPSTRCTIANVEVIGGGNYHAYMIWNLRGEHIQIINNVVDGGLPVPVESTQEGIESFGGKDVFVAWNVVRNIGLSGLNFGSAGHPNTTLERLTAVGNTVSNARKGVHIGTASGPTGPQNALDVRVEDNDFTNLWQTGIDVRGRSGTEIRTLSIVGNRIGSVGTDEISGSGIFFQGNLATSTELASSATNNFVKSNVIRDVRGPSAVGVLVIRYPNVTISDNDVSDIDHSGVFATSAEGLVVESNWIARTRYWGLISSQAPSSVSVRGNEFFEWNTGGELVPGVSIYDATSGNVRDNAFWHQAASPSAVRVEAGSTNVIVFGNQLFSDEPNAVPYVNNGIPSNLGTFSSVKDETTLTVNDVLVSPNSTVLVTQVAGSPLSMTVVPDQGVFRVVADSPPSGDERFRYEVDP